MLTNFLKLVLRSMRHRRLRTTLTVSGIVIGISIVTALIFLGNGLKGAVRSELQQFGSDLIIIIPGDVSNPFSAVFGRGQFEKRDVEAVESVPGVIIVMPSVESELAKGEFRGEKKTISLHGQPWLAIRQIFEESQGFRLREGNWPASEDAKEIILGATFAAKAFDEQINLNDEIIIRGRRFTVVGILDSTGEQNHDNSVFISMEMLKRVTGRGDRYPVMTVKLERGSDIPLLASRIEAVLKKETRVDEFTVLTPDKVGDIVISVIGVVELVLFLIAAVAIIVGGIGIMNTMYTSVMERTREIGIMKAVGAKNNQVLFLFLLESAIIGLVGGFVGLVFGAGLAKYVSFIAKAQGFRFLEISINLTMIFVTLFFAILVGVVSGILPARQAVKLKPAEALKYR